MKQMPDKDFPIPAITQPAILPAVAYQPPQVPMTGPGWTIAEKGAEPFTIIKHPDTTVEMLRMPKDVPSITISRG
jgi:hypothetical protein